ncbi:MAG TPA: hypothetical protein VF859_02070 [Burkholderiales bacterium]
MKVVVSKLVFAVLALGLAGGALAKLPAPSDEAKAKAAEAKAKADHGNKVAAYLLCKSMNAVAEKYAKEQKAKGVAVQPTETPPCADPGPFVPPEQQAAAAAAPPPAAAPAKPAEAPKAAAAAPAAGKK